MNKNFVNLLTKILNDSKFQNEIKINGKKFLDEYLINHGTASHHLASKLAQL